MGIVAFSLACLRPLFRSIYQHSAHLGSHPTTNGPGSTQRARFIYNKSPHRLDDPPLPNSLTKSIHVTTVIDTYSSRNISSDLELGIGGHSEEGSEMTAAQIRGDGWNKGMPGENTFEMGSISPRPERVNAVCRGGPTPTN
jgi:hypothetical protein